MAADRSFEVSGDDGRALGRLVEEAARKITRLEPGEALAALDDGALLVDIRSNDARRREGVIPGSLHIPRGVLEWRLAGESSSRSPYVGGLDQHLILVCDHGYSSILAAATLVDLGFRNVSDVIGGFEAWRTAGLSREPLRREQSDELPGLAPPD